MHNLTNELKKINFNIQETNYAVIDNSWKLFVSFYKFNRFYYIKEGSAELILKNQPLHLQSNKLYYIPSYSIITANCQNSLGHYWIHFNFDNNMSTLYNFIQLKNEAVAVDGDEKLFKRIIELYNSKDNNIQSELELNGIMQQILSRFLSDKNTNKNFLKFIDVLNYIDENIGNKLSITDLADICHLNPVYFSNTFTRVFDVTPSQYIINKRLQNAMIKLTNTNLSVKEIAIACGFEDSLYFSRVFKKKTKMTPLEFRKKSLTNS